MARRKELKNIASSLYGSFISRNNDVGGYWGIGKLCLLAQQHETNRVHLDLLANSIVPSDSEFSKLTTSYRSLLLKQLSAKGLSEERVASAVIELNFTPEHPSGKHIPISTWGNLLKLTVVITDDTSKTYEIFGYSYCGPHNPNKESKSAGAERF